MRGRIPPTIGLTGFDLGTKRAVTMCVDSSNDPPKGLAPKRYCGADSIFLGIGGIVIGEPNPFGYHLNGTNGVWIVPAISPYTYFLADIGSYDYDDGMGGTGNVPVGVAINCSGCELLVAIGSYDGTDVLNSIGGGAIFCAANSAASHSNGIGVGVFVLDGGYITSPLR